MQQKDIFSRFFLVLFPVFFGLVAVGAVGVVVAVVVVASATPGQKMSD
jgi:hypothetical protein